MEFTSENIKKVMPDVVRQANFDQRALLIIHAIKYMQSGDAIKRVSDELEVTYLKGELEGTNKAIEKLKESIKKPCLHPSPCKCDAP